MKKRWIVAVTMVAATFCADAQQVKPEDQLKLRKAVYSIMNYSLNNLDDMVQGKRPYAKDEAVRHAELLAQLSTVPKRFFGDGTDKAGETRAKPEIWTQRADFDAKMDRMTNETGKLAQTAKTGDLAALKKGVSDVEAACLACHDEYRVKRRG